MENGGVCVLEIEKHGKKWKTKSKTFHYVKESVRQNANLRKKQNFSLKKMRLLVFFSHVKWAFFNEKVWHEKMEKKSSSI